LQFAFSQNPVTANSQTTLTVKADANAQLGNFNLLVTATSGQIVRSQTVALSIVQAIKPPTIASISNQMLSAGQVIELPVSAMDDNQSSLSLSLVSAPGYVSLRDNGNGNGVVRIAPSTGAQSGTVTIRATNFGGLTAQTSFQVTVVGGVTITNASFSKPVLTILGSGFMTSGAVVKVNNLDVSKAISSQTDTKIELKGNKKKLGLQKGQNTVVVIVNGVASNTATFNF
jgi:hypothetical protein